MNNERWEILREVVQNELQSRPGRAKVPDGYQWSGIKSLIRLLFEREAATRESVNAAVLQWAQAREWPRLDPWAAYFRNQRLACALDLLYQLTVPGPEPHPVSSPPEELPDAALLVWLLSDTWIVWRSEHWTKLTALSLETGDPLYGIDPA